MDHQDHDAAARAGLRQLADRLGVLATGSSDYHGTGKVDHDLGVNTTDPETYARLRALMDQRALTDQRALRRVAQVAEHVLVEVPGQNVGVSTHKAWVVAVANQKGGVAKTTSVGSLGTAFAEQGLACCWSTWTRRPA